MLSGGGRDFVHQQTLSEKTALGVAQACHPDWGPYSLLLPVLFGVQPRQPECEQKLDPPVLAFFRIPACHHMLIILVCSGLDGRDLGGATSYTQRRSQCPWQSGLGVIIASTEGWPSQRNSQHSLARAATGFPFYPFRGPCVQLSEPRRKSCKTFFLYSCLPYMWS